MGDNWICEDCPLDGNTVGAWDEDSDIFKSVKEVHGKCPNFKKGTLPSDKTPIEQEFDEAFEKAVENGDLCRDATIAAIREQGATHHVIDDKITFDILKNPPQTLHAITLGNDGTRYILVYYQSKVKVDDEEKFQSKAFVFINDGTQKSLIPLESNKIKEKFKHGLFTGFELLNNRWEVDDYMEYLNTDEKIDVKNLYQNLVNLNKIYFENEYEYDYHFQALWIMHTYLYSLFELTPYNSFSGMKNTGKTKRLNLLEMLCFNAILVGHASISSTFRTIHGTGATMLLDESENLKGGKDDRSDMENLLRNGFQKRGKISRSKETKKSHFEPEFFSVYSPKALGHIHGFDNVLEDRCITTKLTRTTNKKIANSEPYINDPNIIQCRHDLYKMFLDHGDDIYKLIPEAKQLIIEQTGREMNLWLPIVTIALFLEKNGVQNLLEKIQTKMKMTSEEKTIGDLEDNLDFKILDIIRKLPEIPTQSQELYGTLNGNLQSHYDYDRKLGGQTLKQALERLGFSSHRTKQGIEWTITPEKIKQAEEKIGLREPIQATLNDTDYTNDDVGNVGSVA